MREDMLGLLKSRRSIRKYKPEQISDAELKAVLEAATFAPTGKGAQSPIIIAVQNKEDCDRLRRMNAALLGISGDPYHGAPTIVLVLADKSVRPTFVEDGSCVLAYIMLAAEALGLGTCWVNREREMFESEEGKALLKKWGVASGDFVGVGACSLGYPEGEARPPIPRKPDYVRIVKSRK
ncbi:MAG: nitroreductase [Deltaproteobacteria bacterium]|jgi:nitroreductase|nr:nitroreductase [Deltaproteobacteria bacterium]